MFEQNIENYREFEVKMKAFSQDPSTGNPAGVVFQQSEIDKDEISAKGKAFGFSESAFIWPSPDDTSDFEIRFSTKTGDFVNMCGHATIASATALLLNGVITKDKSIRLKLSDGSVINVKVNKDELIEMEQKPTEIFDQIFDKNELANLLGISSDLIQGQIKLVSTGSKKLMIPITSKEGIDSITPDFEKMKEYQSLKGINGFYVFSNQTIDPSSDFYTRQFNPAVGINEDPITGIAASALGAHMANLGIQPKNRDYYIVEQGYKLGMGGKILVRVPINSNVVIGGYAVRF